MKIQSDLFSGIVPFVRAAEAQSFSRAAADLGVTTAAVSKAVKKLEDDLGVRLLERSSRNVTLTRAGHVFLERARQAVLGVQGAREAVQLSAKEPQGEIAITLPFIVAPFVVPNLGRLSAQYPRLSFRINLSDRLARLTNEAFDIAVRMGDLDDSTLVARVLRKTRWVTVAAPSYLARHPPLKSPEDLAAHNCLQFVAPSGKPRDWNFREEGREAGRRVRGNFLIDHGTYLLGAAEAGLGVAQVLDFMVEGALKSGNLVEVLSPYSAVGPKIHAVTTAGRAKSANVRAFIRFLTDAFRA